MRLSTHHGIARYYPRLWFACSGCYIAPTEVLVVATCQRAERCGKDTEGKSCWLPEAFPLIASLCIAMRSHTVHRWRALRGAPSLYWQLLQIDSSQRRLWRTLTEDQTCLFWYDISISTLLSGYIGIDIYRYWYKCLSLKWISILIFTKITLFDWLGCWKFFEKV